MTAMAGGEQRSAARRSRGTVPATLIAIAIALAAALAIAAHGCRGGALERADGAGDPGEDEIGVDLAAPIVPLPRELPIAIDPARAALGRDLFFDPILSGDGAVTCASCHALERAGTDGLPRSRAPQRGEGPINVPTVYNLAFVFRYSWSGRFDDIQAMLDVPMERQSALASSWPECVERLRASQRHRAAFEAVYPEGVTEDTLRDAIAQFIYSLTTPDAPFDRWLRGDASAIDEEAREGYELFREYGCASCHQGVNVGGNMYQRFGVMADYFAGRTDLTPADRGLCEATGRDEDCHVFRVPSLRNVALTAPYFHDGSRATLEEAVDTMAQYQLGRPIDPVHRARIVAFLRTLTGRLDAGR